MPNDLKILIIDDNHAEVELLTEAFHEQSLGIAIDSMGNGHKAIITLIKGSVGTVPDVILLDDRLIGITGLDVLKVLSSNHQLEHTPMIMMSGMMEDTARNRCQRSGAIAIFDKPKNYAGYCALAQAVRAVVIKVKTERYEHSLALRDSRGRAG